MQFQVRGVQSQSANGVEKAGLRNPYDTNRVIQGTVLPFYCGGPCGQGQKIAQIARKKRPRL